MFKSKSKSKSNSKFEYSAKPPTWDICAQFDPIYKNNVEFITNHLKSFYFLGKKYLILNDILCTV